MKARTSVGLIAILMTSACASSIQSESERDDSVVGSGVSYYLPKRMVRIEVDRRASNADKAALAIEYMRALQAKNDADAALAIAVTTLNAATGAREAAEALGEAYPASELEKLKSAETTATRSKNLADSLAKNRAKELAEKKRALDAAPASSKDNPTFVETVSVSVTPLVPDGKKRFLAQLPHSWFRSDDWNLTVSPAGLLTKADANPSGEADEVVIELGKVALAVFDPSTVGASKPKFSLSLNKTSDVGAASGCPADKEFHFEYEFDPTDTTAHNTIQQALDDLCALHRVDFDVICDCGGDNPKAFKKGLVYRRERPFSVRVDRFAYNADQIARGADPAAFKPHRFLSLMIPNGAPVEVLPYGGSYVSAQELSATFQDGMLTATNFEKPGEARTVALIPAAVLSGAVGLAGELLTARTKNLTESANGIEQEVKAVEQSRELLQAQIAYEAAYAEYLREKTGRPTPEE